jgi:hypothetical protein
MGQQSVNGMASRNTFVFAVLPSSKGVSDVFKYLHEKAS